MARIVVSPGRRVGAARRSRPILDLPEAPHKQPYGMRSNLGAIFNQAVQAGSPRTLVRTPTPGSGRYTGIPIPRYSRLRGSPYSRRRGSCRPILTGNGDATQASIRIGLSTAGQPSEPRDGAALTALERTAMLVQAAPRRDAGGTRGGDH